MWHISRWYQAVIALGSLIENSHCQTDTEFREMSLYDKEINLFTEMENKISM